MHHTTRILFSAMLLTLLTLSIALPVRAFEERTGDTITIAADEVLEDDLYVAAETVIVDGTIKGDLIIGAQTIIINGTVEGDLLAGARDITINGTVQDDARIFGAAFLIGENAVIGDDLVGAGGSLETEPGSKIGGDLVMGNGQNLLAGDLAGNAKLGTGAIELRGSIGGDAVFALGNMKNEGQQMGPMIFGPEQTITIPNLAVGLKFGPDAKIDGKLEYVADRDLDVPTSIASGGITRTEPIYSEDELREIRRANRTPAESALDASIDVIRTIATLIIVGLFLGWLFPSLLGKLSATIQQKPLPSLGWGVVTYATFFFSLLVIIFVMVLGGVVFGLLTLGGLSGAVVVSGLLALFGVSVGFVLLTAFVTKIAVSLLGGKLILEKINPGLAENKFWPLALGVTLYAILQVIPVLGILTEILVVLLGLGALWLLIAEWRKNRQITAAA